MIEQIKFEKTAMVPVHEQIAKVLKKNITCGILGDGVKLPPEPELAQQFGISRPTLRKSLKNLEEQNLIRQRKGCGTFVSYQKISSKRIALVGVDIKMGYNTYTSNILYGLTSALQETGSEILFMDCVQEESFLNKFHASGCDGIVCVSDSDATVEQLTKPSFNNIPMVFFNNRKPVIKEGSHACVTANPRALEIAVDHLVRLGHKKVAYIAAAPQYSDLKLRNDEFLEVRAEYGLDEDSSLYLEYRPSVPWYDQARDIAKELCSRKELPTAIICPVACTAYGAWQGIMDTGLRIPEDISIIGFDCEACFNPYLSTISQPIVKMAEAAGKMIINIISRNKVTRKEMTFDVKLEERGSCALQKNKTKKKKTDSKK